MPTTICVSSPAVADRGRPDRTEEPVIIACPACRTRFLVDEQELNRPAGRTVRCANCGHTWHRPPPLRRPDSEPAVPPAAPRIEPELAVPPRPGPVPAPSSQRPPRRRRAVGWGVLGAVLVLLVLAALAAIIARKEVVAAWPGPGIELGKVTPTRTANGFVIEGDIINAGSTVRDVPRLRVALRDPAEKETEFKIIDPPTVRLGPGETAHFKTSFEHPDEAAAGVVVTFAR